ncbi:MAG: response regulator transcription factor [Syntrophales bacterium]|nr:response regulator transcription factor [Syntrophales bacterium]
MAALKIIFSHPLLSLSVHKYLESFSDGQHSMSLSDDATSQNDIILTDFTTLKSQKINSRFPKSKIILIDTGLNDQQKRIAVSYYKVRGIIAHTISSSVFEKTIYSISKGDVWLKNQVSDELVMFYGNRTSHKKIKVLTKREKEIIPLVCKGHSNKDIAVEMGISIPTVKALLTKVFRKLDVASRYELFVNVYESGVLEMLKTDSQEIK